MNRRTFLGALAGAAAFFSVSGATVAFSVQDSGRRPNVILILSDDQGWWDVGAYGNKTIETPVMDRLAAEGVRFTQFYCTPVCAPTRAGIMTGRYYQRTGVSDTISGRDNLNLNEITLADMFRRNGYRTGIIGKWHLGRYGKYQPNSRGFEEYFGFPEAYIRRYDDPDELYHNRQAVTASGYITNILTEQAIAFIERNRNSPFFLYLPYNAVHSPYLVPDSFIEKYLSKGVPMRDARIYGMLTALDQNLGRLLKAVDATGLRENTVVIFMSDNGGVSRFFNAGLRGNKESVYEGGVRVPFIARWPGNFPAGASVSAPAMNIDLFPTLCELLGASLPTDRKIDGRSILPLLRKGQGPSPHQYLFYQYNRVQPLLRPPASTSSLSRDDTRFYRPNWAIRDVRGHKLVMSGVDPKGTLELFDLQSDPGEANNIAAAHPGVVRELQGRFEEWFEDVTAGQHYGPVSIEVGRPDEDPIEIDVTWAEPVGKKVLPSWRGYTNDAIENWTEPGDGVRWKIDVVRSGRYEVILNYACRPADAGSRVLIRAGSSQIEHVVQATAARNVFRNLNAGTLDLAQGPAVLEMQAAAIKGQELMLLHKVWLKRIPL